MGHGNMPGGRATMALYTSRTTTHGKARDFGRLTDKRTEAGDKLLALALSRFDNAPNVRAMIERYIAKHETVIRHCAANAARASLRGDFHATALVFAQDLRKSAFGFGG